MLKNITTLLIFLCATSYAASPEPRTSRQHMAVSAHIYATKIGEDILQQGGNAVDAAVAMGYALSVVHPCCGNIGGGGFMLIRFANGSNTFINFREKAPAKATPELYIDKNGRVRNELLSSGHISGTLRQPYLAVGIPGTVMGLNRALAKYGTMPLAKVMAPAIQLAEHGFVLLPGDAIIFKKSEDDFRQEPNVAAIYLKNDRTYAAGEKFIQKELAHSLKAIAKHGTDAFYRGEIAEQIVRASNHNAGLITKNDLAQYTIEELRPQECQYKNYRIITTPPPGSGVTLCEALKIVESYPLENMGFHSAMSSHYILEALRFSYADRNRYLGDPNFVQNPIDKILASSHLREIRHKITPYLATPSTRIQDDLIRHFRGVKNKIEQTTSPEGSNTTSYAVVDNQGNAVSVTYTLNDYFGAKVIPGNTGFFLNNEMADFTIRPGIANNYGLYQGAPNLMAPNKRPLSSMAPTIITRDKQLFMVIGTPGGSTIVSTLVNVILNVTLFGMNIQEAEDMPRFHMQWLPDVVFMERFTFSMDTQNILAHMGYRFQLGSPYGTPYWGAVSGILFDSKNHLLYGGEDSRRSNSSRSE